MQKPKLIDVHCHLYDRRVLSEWSDAHDNQALKAFLINSKSRNIEYYLQGGYAPEDGEIQLKLAEFEKGVLPILGMHPEWVSQQSDEVCEAGLDYLSKNIEKFYALGEIGLDFRKHIPENAYEKQIDVFRSCLEIALFSSKPVVLHLVHSHNKALQILDLCEIKKIKGFVHAFNGSLEMAEEYWRRGLLISIGGAITYSKNAKLQRAVKEIPMKFLLVESDSPDQSPEGWGDHLNDPSSIWQVADVIGKLKGKSALEILEVSKLNISKLLGINL